MDYMTYQWHGGYLPTMEENFVLPTILGTKGLKIIHCTFWEEFACTLASSLGQWRRIEQKPWQTDTKVNGGNKTIQ